MGTQQILLIVLSVIIVGVATAGGIELFNQHAKQAHKQEMIAEINMLMIQAMAYRRTPLSMGGGEGSFVGYSPTGAESSSHVSKNSPGAVMVQLNNVSYYIEWYFNDRLKIIASSLSYGEGRPWPNTYNARITAVYNSAGALDSNGLQVSGEW